MITGISALVGSVPSNPPANWGYVLIGVQGNNSPTVASNQQTLTGVQTAAGIVPAPPNGDGFNGQSSFVFQTPTTGTQWTVYLVSGLTVSGKFQPNNIVPNITPSAVITIGSSTGVIDASQAIATSIAAQLSVTEGQLGITPASLDASTYLVDGTIVANLLASSNLITLSAQIANGIIGTAQCGQISVSVLTAGTATFSGTATFEAVSSGPSVVIASTAIELTGASGYSVEVTSTAVTLSGGASSVTINNSEIEIQNGSNTLTVSSSEIELVNGSYSVTVEASQILLEYSGGPSLALNSGDIVITIPSGATMTASGTTLELAYGSTSTTIDGFGKITVASPSSAEVELTDGEITLVSASAANTLVLAAATATTASAGSETLPSAPQGFLEATLNGNTIKIPYYAN